MKKKYPLYKFVIDHSEEYTNGKTLVMKIGDNNRDDTQNIDVVVYDVEPNENFYITASVDWREPYDGYLYQREKRRCFINLFNKGIKDER